MNDKKYRARIGMLVVVILFMQNYFEFYTCYKGLGDFGEDVVYIYSDTAAAEQLAEGGRKQPIDCELIMRLDINLLRWAVFLMFAFFYGVTAFGIYRCMDRKNAVWGCFIVIFLGFIYIKRLVFCDIGTFPVDVLPEKWSDMEGWGELWECVRQQILYMIQWKEDSFLCRYYAGVIKSVYHMFWMLLLFRIYMRCRFVLK